MDTHLMARSTRIDRSKVPPEMLAKAREQALLKQARIMAEQELGISSDDIPVQKGPLGDEGEIESVYLNFADYIDRITLDGVTYMHGRAYDLPKNKADVVREQMARSWRHQAEIEGKDQSNFYLEQQTRNTAIRLSPKKGTARIQLQ